MATALPNTDKSIRTYLTVALATCLLLVGGVGGLAAVSEIAGAVIGSGTVVVDSNVKKVQHSVGGVVARINVREGDKVRAGDVLLSLDDTMTRAGLGIVLKTLDQFYVRVARLEAERDGKTEIDFSTLPPDTAGREGFDRLAAGERSLFDLRLQAREGQKGQLHQRVLQLGEEISGLAEQQVAKQKEIALVKTELEAVRKLWEQKLTSLERVTELERAAVRLEGEHGSLTAQIAQAKGRSAETELQILQIDQDMRSEVATELREAQAKIAEYEERRIASEDMLKHIDIRSPQDGIVHELAVHTVGGVISPAEALMFIVPVSDDLTIETKIAPQDIDQVAVGQEAHLRLSAFNLQATPELNGVVTRISPDLVVDQRTGMGYYTASIHLPKEELAKLTGQLTLTPGMPVEVFLPTGSRTVLSYLLKPLLDQMSRAFRDG